MTMVRERDDTFSGDVELAAPSARSLLLATLTLHVVPDGGSTWTGALIESMGLLGVNDKACRQAIQRLAADGWIVTERHGRHARLHLTSLAHGQMQRDQHVARFEAATSPREWVVLLLMLEKEHRENRRRLRRSLVSFGWGNVSPGAWLNTGSASQEAALEVLRREGLDGSATFLRADFISPSSVQDLIARTWDLTGLAGRYVAFLDRFQGLRPRTDEAAFVARAQLTDMWMRSFRADPFLPPDHLPSQWPGTPARALLNDRMVRWAPAADRWWKSAVGRAEPGR
jgi:phenylacetic acid degradation operon negative regulatory protein